MISFLRLLAKGFNILFKYLYYPLLLSLLITFIIFIIQYMDNVKKSFLPVNILIGIYIIF